MIYTFLQINWWKNFENQLTFAKVIIKRQGDCLFYWSTLYFNSIISVVWLGVVSNCSVKRFGIKIDPVSEQPVAESHLPVSELVVKLAVHAYLFNFRHYIMIAVTISHFYLPLAS